MKRLILIELIFLTIAVVGCDAVSIVPRAQPTRTPLPTLAPTPTPSPTATSLPPTATPNPATNPLDALRKAFGASNVKSFRGKIVRTSGTTTTESTFEAVLPDRFRVISKTSEIIIIGQTFYIKTGAQWQKVTAPQGFDISLANWKKILDDLGATTEVKFIGADVLDGAPMLVYQYTVTGKLSSTTFTTTSKVWVAVSDNLPRKSESTSSIDPKAKTVATFSNYNDPTIVINPPIP